VTDPATHRAPGFKVTKTENATVFHHVPIFAECERGELSFGADWIAGAVAEAKQQERDGYLPPLHTRHHEPSTDQTDAVRAVGVFKITEASALTFKGKRITAVYADLIVTDEYMAEEIGRMKYPYRSVEIFDPEGSPKINSLALLDHEAPFIELPMLFAGEVDDKRDPRRLAQERSGGAIPDTGVGVANANSFSLNYASDPSNPMLGTARNGDRAVLLFKFTDEETMPQAKPKKAAAPKKPANFADDKEGEEKENMEGDEGGGGLDVAAICSAIESGEISVADMDAIIAAVQAQNAEVVEEAVEDEEPAPAPAPGAEIMKGNSEAAKLFARQQGELDALKAKDAARDAADVRRKAVGVAMKRLEGKPLGSNLQERLTNFHEKAGGNAELFKEYVDTMAATAGDLPVDDNGENFAAQPKTPKSAMAFQALGGEAVDKAATFAREYKAFNGSVRASEESYVRTNMKHLGYELEATTV
jgi:hypothetical protein